MGAKFGLMPFLMQPLNMAAFRDQTWVSSGENPAP